LQQVSLEQSAVGCVSVWDPPDADTAFAMDEELPEGLRGAILRNL